MANDAKNKQQRSAEKLIPACWLKFELSGVAETDAAFANFASESGINPDADYFSMFEHKILLLSALSKFGDEHLGHCETKIPVGTTGLAIRLMNTAATVQEAIQILIDFSEKICRSRKIHCELNDEELKFCVELDGFSPERGALAEITVTLAYLFALSSFVGGFLPITEMHSRSEIYTRLFRYNPDAGCKISFGDFTGFTLRRSGLDMPRRADLTPELWDDMVRWALLAEKFRPVIQKRGLPLLSAERLLDESQALSKRRNIDIRQQRRLTKRLTNHNIRELKNSINASKAMIMIASTNKSYAEIGQELGFSDERSFRRFFVNITQHTPSEYRNIYQDASVAEGREHLPAMIRIAETLRKG